MTFHRVPFRKRYSIGAYSYSPWEKKMMPCPARDDEHKARI